MKRPWMEVAILTVDEVAFLAPRTVSEEWAWLDLPPHIARVGGELITRMPWPCYLGWTPNRFRWSSRLRRLHYGDKKRTATWRPTNMSSGFGRSPKKFIGSCAPTGVLSSISAALGIPAAGLGRFSSMS